MPTRKYVSTSPRKSRKSPAYRTWEQLKQRCENPNNPQWKNYGGRGIKVCEQWRKSFACFIADMGECPPFNSIDRWPDKDGNYEPGNCRWATEKEQHRNQRNNRIYTVKGVTACLMDLCETFGVHHKTVFGRLHRGWPVESALFEPLRKGKKFLIVHS